MCTVPDRSYFLWSSVVVAMREFMGLFVVKGPVVFVCVIHYPYSMLVSMEKHGCK